MVEKVRGGGEKMGVWLRRWVVWLKKWGGRGGVVEEVWEVIEEILGDCGVVMEWCGVCFGWCRVKIKYGVEIGFRGSGLLKQKCEIDYMVIGTHTYAHLCTHT